MSFITIYLNQSPGKIDIEYDFISFFFSFNVEQTLVNFKNGNDFRRIQTTCFVECPMVLVDKWVIEKNHDFSHSISHRLHIG